MNESLKAIDDQMLKWIAELDELHKRKGDIDEEITNIQHRINTLQESVKILREVED